MEIAKITDKGQITIPVDIRKKLKLKGGDKVIFIEDGDNIIMVNAALYTFLKMQKAFIGEAERLDLKNEQDVVNMVDEIRQELWNERSFSLSGYPETPRYTDQSTHHCLAVICDR